ncbi:MAG: hypothetical protein AVDCRST_MAG73-2660 [uncultured Thermomicrobiales bacterium]|uniref:Secreted protein n=1 Tax=uncultured Thermomicrobiales bacterium TaxID=1645740 RepID=A0A6J4UIW1_9BACT|nr:MAG: hypothetical protein AVDCRST_MAG73-2660 [uncultured Thermomicrobiales bacterium]
MVRLALLVAVVLSLGGYVFTAAQDQDPPAAEPIEGATCATPVATPDASPMASPAGSPVAFPDASPMTSPAASPMASPVGSPCPDDAGTPPAVQQEDVQ